MTEMRVTGTGTEYHSSRQRPDRLEPQRPGEHVWTVIVTHVVTPESLRAADRGEQVHLDAETVAVTMRGCFACEEPWSERLSHRRCKGEPRR